MKQMIGEPESIRLKRSITLKAAQQNKGGDSRPATVLKRGCSMEKEIDNTEVEMKTKILISTLGALSLLSAAGTVSAATMQTQMPLPAASVPQFVEPLPLLEFEFINATSGALPGVLAGLPALDGAPFPVNAYEFQAQILPSASVVAPGWPPAACGVDTASYTWGYASAQPTTIRPTYLGPVVVAERGVEANPVYGNMLPDNGVVQSNLPIDQTLDWANPLGLTGPGPFGCQYDANGILTDPTCLNIPYVGPIPIATHLHGGEVAPAYDGGPDAWFTQGNLITGAGWPGAQYNYPNNQQEGMIWFHDHALGITRLNVYAGLAGIQPIIDPANPPLTTLPNIGDGFDIPLIIQDRTFDTNCELMYNLASNPQPNPTVHPFWIPEFIGDTIAVNGKTWPYLNVEPRQYRFRLVNGSNARMYDLTIVDSRTKVKKGKVKTTSQALPLLVIATDDGYLPAAAAQNNLVLGNGERYEIIVDFSAALPGDQFMMMNSARTPFPGGAAPVKGLTDRIMMFNVVANTSGIPDTAVAAGSPLRDPVANPIVPIATGHVPMPPPPAAIPAGTNITRQLTLNEVIGLGGPLELVVNNSKFNAPHILPGCTTPACRETELPQVGDTEIWEIINITADAHPMHTHLTSFQVIDRTPFQAGQWITNYDALLLANGKLPGEGPPNQYNIRNADGAIGGNPAVGPFLKMNGRRLPLPSEQGWKDTVITYPGEVTRIAVRWAPTDVAVAAATPGTNQYIGFDPTVLEGPVGYVWHCHIVDHEDNEMMRNYVVGTARQPVL
jgi:FtsP/CotA-like multicopper oxidase with cupredoxin domain